MIQLSLKHFCTLVTQQVDPQNSPDDLYVGLEHVAPGRMTRTGGGRAQEVQSSKYRFERNDVLYGKLRPYLDKAVLADRRGVCTTELLVLRPIGDVDPRYLAAIVHSPQFIEHAVAGTTGSQHPRTSWHHIAEFPITEAATADQRAFANLVWATHRALRASEAAAESAQELKRATMRELFTRGLRGEAQKDSEIGPIPESWELAQLGSHFFIGSGGTPSRGNARFWVDGNIPWVKTTEIKYNTVMETEEFITAEGLANSAAKMLPIGTLLMAMYGQGVTRGKVAILGIEATCNQACATMNRIANGDIESRYLFHFLTYRYEEIRSMAHGGQQQNLNLDIVRDLQVTFPLDAAQQNEITTILDAIDAKIDLHKRKKAVLEELFRALLHKLMTGEVRVADLDLSALEQGDAV